jgi:hypothetical protein
MMPTLSSPRPCPAQSPRSAPPPRAPLTSWRAAISAGRETPSVTTDRARDALERANPLGYLHLVQGLGAPAPLRQHAAYAPANAPVRPGAAADEYSRSRNDATSVTVARRSSSLSLSLWGSWGYRILRSHRIRKVVRFIHHTHHTLYTHITKPGTNPCIPPPPPPQDSRWLLVVIFKTSIIALTCRG